MTKFLAAAALAALTVAAPLAAHPDHAGHTAPAAVAARLTLDTPVEIIVADPAGKAVLDANVPELATHEHYTAFKQMGLNQLSSYAPDKLTSEVLARIETGLAAIK